METLRRDLIVWTLIIGTPLAFAYGQMKGQQLGQQFTQSIEQAAAQMPATRLALKALDLFF